MRLQDLSGARRVPPCRHRAELEDTRQLYLAAVAEHPSCMRRLSVSGVQPQGGWTPHLTR